MPLAASGAGSPKGKGKKSKKAKGKGPKAKSFFGKDVCLRCDKTGHRAANCTWSSSASGSSKKRVIDLDPMVNMVFHQQSSSSGDLMSSLRLKRPTHRAKHWCQLVAGSPRMRARAYKIRANLPSWLAGNTSCGISSGWRSKGILWMTLSSSAVTSLSDLGVTPKVIHDGWSSSPVFISNTPGRMQCFVILGAAPMLLGRPVLEQLGAVVDFGTGKMKILGGQWTNIERGKQDVMLLKLADNVHNISDFQDPRFDLRAKDDDHSRAEHLRDFLADLRAEGRYDEMQPEAQFTEDPDDEVFLWSWKLHQCGGRCLWRDLQQGWSGRTRPMCDDQDMGLDAEPAGCNQSSHSSSTQEEAHLGASSCKWPMNLNLMRFTSPRCTL